MKWDGTGRLHGWIDTSPRVVHWQPDGMTLPACGVEILPGEGFVRLEWYRGKVTCLGCRAADPRQADLFTGRPHVVGSVPAREPRELPYVDADTAPLPAIVPIVHGGRVLPPVHVSTLPPAETWCGRQGHVVDRSLSDGAASVVLADISVGAVVGPDRLTKDPDLVNCDGCLERRPRPRVSLLLRQERQLSLWSTATPPAAGPPAADRRTAPAGCRSDRYRRLPDRRPPGRKKGRAARLVTGAAAL